MIYTIGSVWRLLIILKPIILTLEYISLKSGLWSNLLRKTAVTITLYFVTLTVIYIWKRLQRFYENQTKSYLFNNRKTRKTYEICSKLTIKTPKLPQ